MIYFLERASVDRWRLLVNVIFIRFGICWIGKEIYKFYKCHKVYKLWVDLKICKFKMLYKICKFKMLYLERASVDRWRILVNVIFIRFGICWIGREIYKFYKCHKVYKLWVDLKICKFKMLYLERASVDRWRILVNVMLFCKPGKQEKWRLRKEIQKCKAH